jgi:uncharacterized phage protein (TIGR01671 family)
MKRRILFRGLSKDGHWRYGDLRQNVMLVLGCTYAAAICNVGVLPETVGEYTNYNDANGKEIFEDDIVSVQEKNRTWQARVSFNNGSFVLFSQSSCIARSLNSVAQASITVIGNIHENKYPIK